MEFKNLKIDKSETKMLIDKAITRPQDYSQVNINEPYEVNYWINAFECTKAQLIMKKHLG